LENEWRGESGTKFASYEKQDSTGFNFVIYNNSVKMKRNVESLQESVLPQASA
jgi:hypothetical protein